MSIDKRDQMGAHCAAAADEGGPPLTLARARVGLGHVLAVLLKHPDETEQARHRLLALIQAGRSLPPLRRAVDRRGGPVQKWMRPVSNASTDYRQLSSMEQSSMVQASRRHEQMRWGATSLRSVCVCVCAHMCVCDAHACA